jgi:hypothetical protein
MCVCSHGQHGEVGVIDSVQTAGCAAWMHECCGAALLQLPITACARWHLRSEAQHSRIKARSLLMMPALVCAVSAPNHTQLDGDAVKRHWLQVAKPTLRTGSEAAAARWLACSACRAYACTVGLHPHGAGKLQASLLPLLHTQQQY